MEKDILLTTLNASYSHCSFGLRYLLANLGELRERSEIREFTIRHRSLEIAEALLAQNPRIIGMGVYIWNARESLELVSLLKRIRPDVCIVLGGPEVSYDTAGQAIVELADHTITGEADIAFADFCRAWLAGEKPVGKFSAAKLPHFAELQLPYHEYTAEDIAQRVVYVEASRGCPFTCEFCLSSLPIPVRAVPVHQMLDALKGLLDRGLRQFKFVDRTFNLNLNYSRSLLQFFLDNWQDGLFLHFEMIPDRLPEGLREVIRLFPPGSLQFEVGIQTFQELASKNISRRNDHVRTEDNFAFLRRETGVHIHADLIVGLPGEDAASFGTGFDRLLAMGPQEIQVGMLKRLKGTPIVRHDATYGMVYAAHPPYEILATKDIPFEEMQTLRRFAKYWDMVGNSGNFPRTLKLLWQDGTSPYARFRELTEFLYARLQGTDGINLLNLLKYLHEFLTKQLGHDSALAASELWTDYTDPRPGIPTPGWIQDILGNTRAAAAVEQMSRSANTKVPARQRRHQMQTAAPASPETA